MSPPRVLVTGASGFIGRATCAAFRQSGFTVRQSLRSSESRRFEEEGFETSITGNLQPDTDWSEALHGAEFVVHLAARVHVLRETAIDPEAEFNGLNVAATQTLAKQSAERGIRRLIFLSTIGVHGNRATQQSLRESDPRIPYDAYTRSKVKAENALLEIGERSGMEITVLRPPLVYGPENPGNFLRLLQLAALPIPLPLGQAREPRAMIYVENLADAIVNCVSQSAAANQSFLLSDNPDFSTAELVDRIRTLLGRRPANLNFPIPLLMRLAGVVGFGSEMEKLTAALRVDSSKIRRQLAWSPPIKPNDGLAKTVHWFKSVRLA